MTKLYYKGDSFFGYQIKKYNRKKFPYVVLTWKSQKITDFNHFQTKKLAENWIKARAKRLGVK